jgi:hypothetical protein
MTMWYHQTRGAIRSMVTMGSTHWNRNFAISPRLSPRMKTGLEHGGRRDLPPELAKFQERRLDVGGDDEHLRVWT